jgi:hypothetical protein
LHIITFTILLSFPCFGVPLTQWNSACEAELLPEKFLFRSMKARFLGLRVLSRFVRTVLLKILHLMPSLCIVCMYCIVYKSHQHCKDQMWWFCQFYWMFRKTSDAFSCIIYIRHKQVPEWND